MRFRYLRWGATDQEVGDSLPGDDLVPNADMIATRAITIRAAADQVWPWIAQLGQGRGGFYSYDRLENLVGCNIHSSNRILLEWQDIKVGDEIRLAPQVGLAGRVRGAGAVACSARRHSDGKARCPIRLHLGVHAPRGAGRNDAAARA